MNCAPQPLPPADIMAAAAVLFATGGALAPGSGVGQGAASWLGPHALGLESYYAPWILADLAHWAASGISKVSLLFHAWRMADTYKASTATAWTRWLHRVIAYVHDVKAWLC